MRRRRLILVVLLLALLAGAAAIAWRAFDMPPVRLVLKYGCPSPMGPTGRTVTVEGVEFVEISPGYFRMGSHYYCEKGDLLGRLCALVGLPWGKQPRHGSDGGFPRRECPVHWVEFREGFWIARTEVTNARYEQFDLEHERIKHLPEEGHPVECVSWEDAKLYCAWLAARSGLPARLPSEAEWECVCRAGSESEYHFGEDEEGLEAYAWFDGNSGGTTHKAATRKPNAWGFHDLHGSVSEWCEDTWHDSYEGKSRAGSAWTSGDTSSHVCRGGSWNTPAGSCRSACRDWWHPASYFVVLGFRPAFSTTTDAEREALRRYMERTGQTGE